MIECIMKKREVSSSIEPWCNHLRWAKHLQPFLLSQIFIRLIPQINNDKENFHCKLIRIIPLESSVSISCILNDDREVFDLRMDLSVAEDS